ncbi:MAG: hypothetical protein IJW37_09040 [Lachnospiraceae bacterium]|nr:hypothetical protein [Lachnospiraceae bacterium]
MSRLYRILYLVAVFFVAAVFFGSRLGETMFAGETETVDMGESEFPTVSVLTCGEEINCLYGYSSNLDTILNREDMIPVDESGIFELKIKEYDMVIRRLKYEILDVSSEAEVDSGTINAFDKKEDYKLVRIKLKTELKEGTEYAVKITLINNVGKRMYYYFRIKQYDNPQLTEKLDFIRMFGEKTRSAETEDNEAIIPYLEMQAGAPEDTFGYVDIHSNYRLVAWGGLAPTLVTEPVISVTEFYDEIMTAVVRYCATLDTGYGEEVYFVKEYFRIRYLGKVVHLLNYERHTEALFDPSNASLSQSDLKIGITAGGDLELYPNSDHSMVAFVRNGGLYCYSLADNTLSTVFSSLTEQTDRMYGQQEGYDIRVVKMEENGDITFLVNGYMNRGVYEGRVGLFVYRYFHTEKRLEELIYVPVNTTYQILKEELGEFAYLNEYDVFHFMVDRSLYAYNLITEELKEIASDIGEDDYVYSVTGRYIAYQEHGQTDRINILYPETGNVAELLPGEGEYIKLLDRSDENLVCGYGNTSELIVNEDGSVVYAMYKVRICSATGQLKKEYRKEGYYVQDASADGNVIRLDRLVRNKDGNYEATVSDYILNQDKSSAGKIALAERVTERLLTEQYITFPSDFVMEELPNVADVLYTVVEEDTTLRINEMETEKEEYYTYYYGMIDGIYESAADAILAADEKVGTVINEEGKIVWERGIKASSASVGSVTGVRSTEDVNTIQAAVKMMLSTKGVTADITAEEATQPIKDVMERYTKSRVVVLTGTTLDEVLYFVWKGQPVLAMKESGEAVVITSYNAREIVYYDPARGRNVTASLEAAETLFSEGGNIFISFLY